MKQNGRHQYKICKFRNISFAKEMFQIFLSLWHKLFVQLLQWYWWSNCEFICNNSITIWECQKRYHFRDNEYETTGINVSPRRHMTRVVFILHKCDKMGFSSLKRMSKTKVSAMWGMKFRGVTTMKRGVFWWGRLQGKLDRILILWIRNDFIEIFGVKYNLAL